MQKIPRTITVCEFEYGYRGYSNEYDGYTDYRSYLTDGFIAIFNRGLCVIIHVDCLLKKESKCTYSNCDGKAIKTFEVTTVKMSYLTNINFDMKKQVFMLNQPFINCRDMLPYVLYFPPDKELDTPEIRNVYEVDINEIKKVYLWLECECGKSGKYYINNRFG